MKTTLDHLPEEKQTELGRIVPIIRNLLVDLTEKLYSERIENLKKRNYKNA